MFMTRLKLFTIPVISCYVFKWDSWIKFVIMSVLYILKKYTDIDSILRNEKEITLMFIEWRWLDVLKYMSALSISIALLK